MSFIALKENDMQTEIMKGLISLNEWCFWCYWLSWKYPRYVVNMLQADQNVLYFQKLCCDLKSYFRESKYVGSARG